MPCSRCNLPGHNIRTCGRQESSTEATESASVGKQNGVRKPEVMLTRFDDTSKSTKSRTQARKEVRALQDEDENEEHYNYLLQQLNKKITSKTPLEENAETDRYSTRQPVAVLIPSKPSKTSRNLESKDDKEAGAESSTVSKTKSDESGSSGTKALSQSYAPYTDKVNEVIGKGPSEQDGPGYIYMYKIDNQAQSTAKVDENREDIYKIGMTMNLPERRIAATQRANGEKYTRVFSTGVAWRKLTENIIKHQLKSRQYHRDVRDGGTEWFQGDRKKLIEVILDAKKVAQYKYPDGEEPKEGL